MPPAVLPRSRPGFRLCTQHRPAAAPRYHQKAAKAIPISRICSLDCDALPFRESGAQRRRDAETQRRRASTNSHVPLFT